MKGVNNDAVEEALCFGWIDGIKRSIDDEHYTHRFSPRKPDSRWSRSNKERVERLLDAGLMTPAGAKTIEQAKKNGSWQKPVDGARRFPMPPELAARLGKSRKAAAFFDSLAPSYRRQYIDWIASAKRPETRKRRLDEALELLTRGRKLGMR